MMQLVQTSIIKQIGQHFFKTAMTVLFQLEQGQNLQKLTTVFQQNQVTGVVVGIRKLIVRSDWFDKRTYTTCVSHLQHFKNENSAENPPQIMILLLMKKAPAGLQYIGFIPNDQKQFIENLKKAVANHKIQQQQQMQMQQMQQQQQQQQQQSSGQQVWPLTQFDFVISCKWTFICFEGESTTPHWGGFCPLLVSFQKPPSISPHTMRWNYRDKKIPSPWVCRRSYNWI